MKSKKWVNNSFFHPQLSRTSCSNSQCIITAQHLKNNAIKFLCLEIKFVLSSKLLCIGNTLAGRCLYFPSFSPSPSPSSLSVLFILGLHPRQPKTKSLLSQLAEVFRMIQGFFARFSSLRKIREVLAYIPANSTDLIQFDLRVIRALT